MNHLALITSDTLKIEQALDFVSDKSLGAQSFFVGTVRNNLGRGGEKKVHALFYEAHEHLARKALLKVAQAVNEKVESKVYLAHRVGLLLAGEASLIIAVSTQHREDAFFYSRFCIEEIKKTAVVYKKEIYEDKSHQWLKGTILKK